MHTRAHNQDADLRKAGASLTLPGRFSCCLGTLVAAWLFQVGLPTGALAAPALVVVLADSVVAPGGVVHGEVVAGELEPVENLLGVGFHIEYDGSVFHGSSVYAGPFLGGAHSIDFTRVNDGAGYTAFSVVRTSGVGVSGVGVVCVFQLTVDSLAADGFKIIRIGDVSALDASGGTIYITTAAKGIQIKRDVSSVPGPGGGAAVRIMAPPAPNPASRAFRVGLTLEAPEQVALDLVDASGRLVASLARQSLSAGRHELEFELARAGAPPAGVYFLRLDAGVHREVRRLVIVR